MSRTARVVFVDGEPIGYFPPTNAENVEYGNTNVEAALDGLSSGKVNKSGDTMSGRLTVNATNNTIPLQIKKDHTGTTPQLSALEIGNILQSGSVSTCYGGVYLWGKGNKSTLLQAPNSTADRTIDLPDASGTLALRNHVDINSGTNLNDCLDENTVYFISGANIPINAPSAGAYNAEIWNISNGGNYSVQFYYSYNLNKQWFRFREVLTWKAWNEVALASDFAPSSDTLIQSISVGGSANYTPTSNGFVSLVCSSDTANQTIKAIIRDSVVTSYGVTIQATVDAYSNEPIGYMPVKAGRTYTIRNSSTSTKAISLYFCK